MSSGIFFFVLSLSLKLSTLGGISLSCQWLESITFLVVFVWFFFSIFQSCCMLVRNRQELCSSLKANSLSPRLWHSWQLYEVCESKLMKFEIIVWKNPVFLHSLILNTVSNPSYEGHSSYLKINSNFYIYKVHLKSTFCPNMVFSSWLTIFF